MSGFDPKTGLYELTATKARSWFRRAEVPESCSSKDGMHFYAEVLRHFGALEIVLVRPNFLRARATADQVWEALSGLPARGSQSSAPPSAGGGGLL